MSRKRKRGRHGRSQPQTDGVDETAAASAAEDSTDGNVAPEGPVTEPAEASQPEADATDETEPPDPDALIAAGRFVEALEVLNALERSPGRDARLVDALLSMERRDEAVDNLKVLLEHAPDPYQPTAMRLKAAYLRRYTRWVDDGIEAADQALAYLGRHHLDQPGVAAAAHLEAARGFAAKRCPRLAEERVDAALGLVADMPDALFVRGLNQLDADDRPAAHTTFSALLELGEEGARLGRYGLAKHAFLMGQFSAAHQHLDALSRCSGWPAPVRLRGELHAAEHHWAEAAAEYAALAEAGGALGPSERVWGARSWFDAVAAAAALYRAGDLDGAQRVYKEVADGAPSESWPEERAMRWLRLDEHARQADEPAEVVRLRAFPTVSQLQDHCGPASCELYLRYFGRDASQSDIAADIKEPDGGTPVYRMRSYLEARGLRTLRVEANLERLERLLDAGIPVIMEEEYSSSTHVAVAVGYDRRQQVLEVQDPASHRIRETPYEDLEKLRHLSNHGALIAVPADDPQWEKKLADAGAEECRYISLVDEAWSALDAEEPEKGDRLVDEAIALHRSYEYAWIYRFRRAREAADDGDSDARVRLHQVLGQIEGMWPDDEWPQQYRGQVLYGEDRYREALVAFSRARDRDPDDAYNWFMSGLCERWLGDDEACFDALREALARDPGYARASGYVADAARDRDRPELAWLSNRAAREIEPDNAFHHGVHGELLEDEGRHRRALAAYARSAKLEELGWVLDRRARLLARTGKMDRAAELLEKRIEADDSLSWKILMAELELDHGKSTGAIKWCKKIVAQDEDCAAGYAIRAAAEGKLHGSNVSEPRFAQALALRPVYPWVHARRGDLWLAEKKHGAALEAYAAALGMRRSAENERNLGHALVKAGHPSDGVSYLKSAALADRPDDDGLMRLATLLAEHDAGQIQHTFGQLAEKHPGDVAILRAHAHALVECHWATHLAAPVLAEIARIVPSDPLAQCHRGSEMIAADLEAEEQGLALMAKAARRYKGGHFARRSYAEQLYELGYYGKVVNALKSTPNDYVGTRLRMESLAVTGKLGPARKALDAFARSKTASPIEVLRLRHRLAMTTSDFATALALAEQLSHETNERDDDGRVDTWEQERFICLARSSKIDRAEQFAMRHASDGASLGSLAWRAMFEHAIELAVRLAERSLFLDPREAYAMGVLARHRELSGDVEGALEQWSRAGETDPNWHSVPEQMARVLMGSGDLERAQELASQAVEMDHTCAWALSIRGQARLLTGDRDGGLADLDRAWGRVQPRYRGECADLWGTRAALRGKAKKAERLWKRYGKGPDPVCANDLSRLERLREAALAAI